MVPTAGQHHAAPRATQRNGNVGARFGVARRQTKSRRTRHENEERKHDRRKTNNEPLNQQSCLSLWINLVWWASIAMCVHAMRAQDAIDTQRRKSHVDPVYIINTSFSGINPPLLRANPRLLEEPARHCWEPTRRSLDPNRRALKPAHRAWKPARGSLKPSGRFLEQTRHSFETTHRPLEPDKPFSNSTRQRLELSTLTFELWTSDLWTVELWTLEPSTKELCTCERRPSKRWKLEHLVKPTNPPNIPA